jgi:ribosomal-protein-alanine N-acetyltransferase
MATIELLLLDRHDWGRVAEDPVVGTCAFTAPPDDHGIVEIAYFTFPEFEGQGYGSAMAAGLVEQGDGAAGVRRLRAHTLPERNASTRILEKVGFDWLGGVIDPEDGPIWRGERHAIDVMAKKALSGRRDTGP